MAFGRLLMGAVAAAALAAAAHAQTTAAQPAPAQTPPSESAPSESAPARPDPVRLQLARQVLQANDGARLIEAQMKAMFSTVAKVTDESMPPESSALTRQIFDVMQAEEIRAIPKLMDDAAEVYAEHLTETELRDMLAWVSSESGRSIRAKSPAMTQDLLMRQAPLMKQMMAQGFHTAVEHACAQTGCTPQQRQQLAAVEQQLFPSPS